MKYDVAPWRRREPPGPTWTSVRFHPAQNGREYTVRLSPTSTPFIAIKTHSLHTWRNSITRDLFEDSHHPQMEYFGRPGGGDPA
jgi:hypothetical protein